VKVTLVLFFLMMAFVGFARAEENPKAEYVWAEPMEETQNEAAAEAPGDSEIKPFAVKPVI